jgi:hypothetical protein
LTRLRAIFKLTKERKDDDLVGLDRPGAACETYAVGLASVAGC